MAYFLDLCTPETWKGFRKTTPSVVGFRPRFRRVAFEQVNEGDIFLCYLTRLSRWCGVLQVQSSAYEDDSPRYKDPDPYTIRFRVKPVVVLDPEAAIPIFEDDVWTNLSITKRHQRGSSRWTGFFRGSLNKFDDADGAYLVDLLTKLRDSPKTFPFTEKDRRQLVAGTRVRATDREVEVEVPEVDDEDTTVQPVTPAQERESILMQAKVAKIGAQMGFLIWVPRNDKEGVLKSVPETMHDKFVDVLPLNYNDTTLRTIEQIDVLWLKGRSMARAFEVEHTTAIYSGLLRMADLLALQPNMNIRLHIVAPDDRREKVLREIRRPVFSLLDRGPLYEQCSFLSYDSVKLLDNTPHLAHMSDSIIAEYEETTEV